MTAAYEDPGFRTRMVVFDYDSLGKPIGFEPWYWCEDCGRSAPGRDWDRPNVDLRTVNDNWLGWQCPFCPCENNMPMSCNWRIVCSDPDCDDGCNFSDCCDTVQQFGTCPHCDAPAHLELMPIQTNEYNPYELNDRDLGRHLSKVEWAPLYADGESRFINDGRLQCP